MLIRILTRKYQLRHEVHCWDEENSTRDKLTFTRQVISTEIASQRVLITHLRIRFNVVHVASTQYIF